MAVLGRERGWPDPRVWSCRDMADIHTAARDSLQPQCIQEPWCLAQCRLLCSWTHVRRFGIDALEAELQDEHTAWVVRGSDVREQQQLATDILTRARNVVVVCASGWRNANTCVRILTTMARAYAMPKRLILETHAWDPQWLRAPVQGLIIKGANMTTLAYPSHNTDGTHAHDDQISDDEGVDPSPDYEEGVDTGVRGFHNLQGDLGSGPHTLPDTQHIQLLHVAECPRLTQTPPLPSVTDFRARACPSLVRIGDMPSLHTTVLSGCNALTDISGCEHTKHLSVACPSLQCLPRGLRALDIRIADCRMLSEMPMAVQLRVKVLCVVNSGLRVLHHTDRLKILHLTKCDQLVRVYSAPCLKQLYMRDCNNIGDLPWAQEIDDVFVSRCTGLQDISAVAAAQCIRVEECPSLGRVPLFPRAQSVHVSGIRDKLAFDEREEQTYAIIRECPAITSVHGAPLATRVAFSHLGFLRASGDFPSAQDVSLEQLTQYVGFASLATAATVTARACPLLHSLRDFRHATTLYITACDNMTCAQPSEGVQTMRLYGCNSLLTIKGVHNIQELHVQQCGQLLRLHSLDRASVLALDGCPRLRTIPDLPAAEEVYIEGCNLLKRLPRMQVAINVIVGDCKRVAHIPSMRRITDLCVVNCPSIHTFENQPSVEQLVLKELPRLERMPSEAGASPLSRLAGLLVHACPNITSVNTHGPLAYVEVRDCPRLDGIQRSSDYGSFN